MEKINNVEREIKRNQWKRSTKGSLKKMNNIETLGEKSRVRICEEEEKGKNQERAEDEETDQKRDGEAMRDIKKGDMTKKGEKTSNDTTILRDQERSKGREITWERERERERERDRINTYCILKHN